MARICRRDVNRVKNATLPFPHRSSYVGRNLSQRTGTMASIVALQSSRWIYTPGRWSNGYPKPTPTRFTLPQMTETVPCHKISGLDAAKGVVFGTLFGLTAWFVMGALTLIL
jgi:hypothetical protein